MSLGGTCNNHGLHGTGVATVADSLAAIKKYVFDEKRITTSQMIQAAYQGFYGYEVLLDTLRNDPAKMGNLRTV